MIQRSCQEKRRIEGEHYYPFGLQIAAISSKAEKWNYSTNKYRYNGKEIQNQEFADGSGLEEYDYNSRNYDPQLGRWGNIDAHAMSYNMFSPYVYVGNKGALLREQLDLQFIRYLTRTNYVPP